MGKRERRRRGEGRTESVVEGARLGQDSLALRESCVGLSDRLGDVEQRAGGVEEDRTDHGTWFHSSTGTCQNWTSTPNAERGCRKAVRRPGAKSKRSTISTPARSNGTSAVSRSST